MSTRFIPLVVDQGDPLLESVSAWTPGSLAVDGLKRPLRDLRISVIDQCNFRCSYCMPKETFGKNYRFLPKDDLLSIEEIESTARAFVALGVRKIRLTGGEPLLRKDLHHVIEALTRVRPPSGDDIDLALTTNGSLLARKARVLRQSGLRRVTVSLDALDDTVFQAMNDVAFPVKDVLSGIDHALAEGLGPVKVNMVVKRGENDDQAVPMARYFRDRYGPSVSLRFIEFMDVGRSNHWVSGKVVPSRELVQRLHEQFALEPVSSGISGETAERWRYIDGRGEVGFVSSVSQPFCGECNRARVSADGRLFTCLFADRGVDLRSILRGQVGSIRQASPGPQALERVIASVWNARMDRYSETRFTSAGRDRTARVEMHYIGG